MPRSSLTVTLLEDRSTPATLAFTTKLTMASVSTPPQDPMDNPPPAQPGGSGSTSPPVSPPPSPPAPSQPTS
jgi:hypothetical protein